MRKIKIDAGMLLLLLILVLLAGGIVFAVSYLRSDPMLESLDTDKVINTLFVIEDDGKPLCSYLLVYYPATKRAAVFDIPGSLGMILQRINRVDRIDSVYDPRRITLFTDELENLLGIEIPFSFVFTLENFGKAVDLIEGVELFIPQAVDEYADTPDDADNSQHQGTYILFPSGLSYLDGDKARLYATYELPEESDELAYYRRQRLFLSFIKHLGIKNEFLKNPQAAKVFYSLIKTTVRRRTAARLFDEFARINTDRMGIQSVGGNVREVSGQPLLFPHWDGSLIKEIVRQTVGTLMQAADTEMGDRSFTVEVLNGTSVNGLAGRTAELYRGFGYDIMSIGNADRNDYEKTVIIYRAGLEDTVMAFGEVIRCNNIQYEAPVFPDIENEINFQDINFENLNFQADITLVIGKDFNGRYVTN